MNVKNAPRRRQSKIPRKSFITFTLASAALLSLLSAAEMRARAQAPMESHAAHSSMPASGETRATDARPQDSGAAEQPTTEQMPAAVHLSTRKQQTSGVRIAKVEERELKRVIRTVGLLQADETRIRHIHTKVSGWIDRLYVNFTGQLVNRGQPIVSIYSPELVSTQVEYLLALKGKRLLGVSPYPEASAGSESLLQATRQRLLFWDITPEQIRDLEKRGEPKKALVLHSPITGFVTIKEIYEGMYVTSGMDLYTITDLSRVWAYLDVYEYELPLVRIGQPVSLSLAYFPGETFHGRVTYIYPTLDPQTRTNKIRVEFPNADYKLKPDMYASAELGVELGKHLAVPEDAVLDSGTEQYVFEVAGDGHFEPRRLTLGSKAEGYYRVLSGIEPNTQVVASANFLVDSESRLSAAMGAMAGHAGMPQSALPPAKASEARGTTIQIATKPDPPHRGRNKVLLTIRDEKGLPITKANVSVTFLMPPMPSMGMPAVSEQAAAVEQGDGLYSADVKLESGGTWQVSVRAEKAGASIASKQIEIAVGGGM